VLRSGVPWRDLLNEYGRCQTAYCRFRRWQEAGIWDRILTALQVDAAHEGTLADTLAMSDGTSIRAHQHAAGAPFLAPPPNSAAVAAAGAANCTSSPNEVANPSSGS
jgi:transposase